MSWLPVTRRRWSATGLPAGLSLDAATGTFSGKVTSNAGTYTFTVQATNAGGNATKQLSVVVSGT